MTAPSPSSSIPKAASSWSYLLPFSFQRFKILTLLTISSPALVFSSAPRAPFLDSHLHPSLRPRNKSSPRPAQPSDSTSLSFRPGYNCKRQTKTDRSPNRARNSATENLALALPQSLTRAPVSGSPQLQSPALLLLIDSPLAFRRPSLLKSVRAHLSTRSETISHSNAQTRNSSPPKTPNGIVTSPLPRSPFPIRQWPRAFLLSPVRKGAVLFS